MALIRCNQCGNMVSENAQACPHCGNPMYGGYGGYGQPPQNYNQFNHAYNNPNPYNNAYTPVAPKSKTTAALLALFLGGLGIHYFYLNKPIPGIVFLVLCWTWIPALLALVQAIMMFTMNDEQFNAKYVNTPNQFPLF